MSSPAARCSHRATGSDRYIPSASIGGRRSKLGFLHSFRSAKAGAEQGRMPTIDWTCAQWPDARYAFSTDRDARDQMLGQERQRLGESELGTGSGNLARREPCGCARGGFRAGSVRGLSAQGYLTPQSARPRGLRIVAAELVIEGGQVAKTDLKGKRSDHAMTLRGVCQHAVCL